MDENDWTTRGRPAIPAVDLQQRDQPGVRFVPVSSGSSTYLIKPMTPDYCLDVSADSTASGAAIIQYPCNYASNEEFTLTSVGTNQYHVIAVNSGFCVAPRGSDDRRRRPRPGRLQQRRHHLDDHQMTPASPSQNLFIPNGPVVPFPAPVTPSPT